MDNLKEQGETDTKKGDEESFTFRNGRVSKVSSGGIQKVDHSQLPLVNNSDEFPQEGSPDYSSNGKNMFLKVTVVTTKKPSTTNKQVVLAKQ